MLEAETGTIRDTRHPHMMRRQLAMSTFACHSGVKLVMSLGISCIQSKQWGLAECVVGKRHGPFYGFVAWDVRRDRAPPQRRLAAPPLPPATPGLPPPPSSSRLLAAAS